MQRKSLLRLICAALLSTSLWAGSVHSDWYESTGSASVRNQTVEQARARAIENALRQSLDFSGGRISSVEHVVDGVLAGSFFEWSTEGAIEHAELVRERRNGDRIEVTVRANIRQVQGQCPAANFRKGVTVVPFEFAQPEQARLGEIWELERSASAQFSQLLGQYSQTLFLEHRIDRKVGLADMRAANNDQAMISFARRVGKETDAQYVVAGVFDDISASQAGRNYTFWTPANQNRALALTLYLFDGASGELLTRAQARDAAPWGFKYNESVDAHSQYFWQSAYGNVLNHALQDMVTGFEDKLACEEPRGQVVQVAGNEITVNLGENHGVSAGQTLHIYHRGNFVDDQNIYREQWILSSYQLEIIQTERSSALAHVVDNQGGTNIQVNDRVVVR